MKTKPRNSKRRSASHVFIASFPRPSFEPEHVAKAAAANSKDSNQASLSVVLTADKTTDNTLSANEQAILVLISANPSVTQKEMAAALDLSEDGARYHTEKLKAKGLLRRNGGKKMGHWEVIS